jgi:hypothetical protein
VGIIAFELFISPSQNRGMDWGNIVNFTLFGFIGILVGSQIRNAFKKESINILAWFKI